MMTGLRDDIEAAVTRGLGFVLGHQDVAGSWTDWELPPGPSPDWTTAYVGFRLSGLGLPFRPGLVGRLDQAARWLLGRRFADGGWGYNETVESDADSTALAVLFLASAGCPAPDEAYAHLSRFQQPDGGFSTFIPDGLTGSWGLSHPEITPVVLLALRTRPNGAQEDVLARGLAWIRRARRTDGTWHSFWWSTPLPATEANLALLAALGTPERPPAALAQWDPGDSLEAAHLLSISAAAGPSGRVETLARRLIAEQAADGSWQSAPALRVTSRNSARPWEEPTPGPLFADPRRLFGTATAVGALGTLHRHLTGQWPRG
jgi:hypothetical protein